MKRRARVYFCVLLCALAVGGIVHLYPSAPPRKAITAARLNMLRIAIGEFILRVGRPPSGCNAEIISALAGKDNRQNPKGIVFFRNDVRTVGSPQRSVKEFDAAGNFLDAWETPLVITVNGGEGRYTVRSNGPNGVDEGGDGDDIAMDCSFPTPIPVEGAGPAAQMEGE